MCCFWCSRLRQDDLEVFSKNRIWIDKFHSEPDIASYKFHPHPPRNSYKFHPHPSRSVVTVPRGLQSDFLHSRRTGRNTQRQIAALPLPLGTIDQ